MMTEEGFSKIIVESTPDSMYVIDPAGSYLFMNAPHKKRLGLSGMEYLGKSFRDFHTEDESERFLSIISDISGKNVSLKDEYEKEGRWYLRQIIPVKSPLTRETVVMVWSTDITDRKSAEIRLFESEAMYRSLVESTADSIYLVDRECRYLFMNSFHQKRMGFNDREYVGKKYREFHDEYESTFFESLVTEIFSTGNPSKNEYERNGRWFLRHLSPVKLLDDGPVISVNVISQEITDRKLSEHSLQLQNSYLMILNRVIQASSGAGTLDQIMSAVLNHLLDLLNFDAGGIYLMDSRKEAEILYCDKGFSKEEVKEISLLAVSTTSYSASVNSGSAVYFENVANIPLLFRPFQFSALAVIPLMAESRVIGSLVLASYNQHDFTPDERKLLESIGPELGSAILRCRFHEDLVDAQKQSNLYIDIMAHDISNAHTVSLLWAGLLEEMLEGEPREYMQYTVSGIQKANEIIRNVETIRRIHTESDPLRPVLLDTVIQNEGDLFATTGIVYEKNGLKVRADRLIGEIFTNCIGNSVKFGGKNVTVYISAKDEGESVVITVADNGPGIPDKEKTVIFNRLSRGKTDKMGKGLGLFIIKSLVDRYGGKVWVEDRVPGDYRQGVAILISLPKASEQE